MRKGFLGSIAALAGTASLAWGQTPIQPIEPLITPEIVQTQSAAPVEAGSPFTDPVPFGGGMMPPGGPGGFGPIGGGMGPIGGQPYGGMPSSAFGQPPMPSHPGGGHPGGGHQGQGFSRLYGGVDYLLWFPKALSVPVPLVTTSAPLSQGILGLPTTQVLAGGEDVGFNTQSGVRINLGGFISPNGRIGFDVSGFIMEPRTVSTIAASDTFGSPTLARPFTDSTSGLPSSLLISYPNYATGTTQVDVSTKLWGTEGSLLLNMYRSDEDAKHRLIINTTVGYRYLQLDEGVTVNSTTNVLTRGVNPNFDSSLTPGVFNENVAVFGGLFTTGPVNIGVLDSFRTVNQFNGASFGLNGELRWNRWVMSGSSKIGVGVMHQQLEVVGQSTLTPGFPSPQTGVASANSFAPGGLLATVGSIGKFNDDKFAVIPELNFQLGFALTRNITMFGGYNFLYISDVVRPGDQMTNRVDASLVPASFDYGRSGLTPVTRTMQSTEYWIHGLNFGVQLQF